MTKKYLTTLNDALAFQLSSMYDAEHKLRLQIPLCYPHTSFIHLQNEMVKYTEQSSNKITKLERIFNYLMEEPTGNPNGVVDKMMEEINEVMKHATSPRLRDVMLTSSLLALNHYKMGVYSCAQVVALELEIETVSDLLSEIVHWEKETNKMLSKIALEEIVYHTGYSLR
jgi:ferritin-like metal-binding protein YciE